MIWDKLSPFYDFMKTVYNGKCYRGIAEKIKQRKKNAIVVAKLLSAIGIKFARQFSLASYKEFIASHNITQVNYSVVDGRMPCVFAIITNC